MQDDLQKTLDAIHTHKWHVVLLAPRSKRPIGSFWKITQDLAEVVQHIDEDGNLGLVCGPESRTMVLDFDNVVLGAEMFQALGPLSEPWVRTGSGKMHFYCQWEDGLPAKLDWKGERVGEIQRGPALQHVVMPPSVHPDTGLSYFWLTEPTRPLPILPEKWRQHLKASVPDFIPLGDRSGHPEDEPWLGPPAQELLRRAMKQPGARTRRNGIKFQCPGCRKEGRDRHRDNALVALDGRWGCAVEPRHSRDIGEALGVVSVEKAVLGDDEDDLREPTIDDLE